ncbi:hypothetical protein, partial [Caballeronia sp. INDeC2]|uniref:hypothetical protein n=1 Tax=Caballeronia sp. INDeC2 TaxID=2921747 RepID=UPI00202954AE
PPDVDLDGAIGHDDRYNKMNRGLVHVYTSQPLIYPEARLEIVRIRVDRVDAVSYKQLTLPTIIDWCRSRWSEYHFIWL